MLDPMLTTTLARLEGDIRKQQIVWVALNKGILTRIAEELEVSAPMVGDVLRGYRTSRDGRIEAKLASLGAPGFKSDPAA